MKNLNKIAAVMMIAFGGLVGCNEQEAPAPVQERTAAEQKALDEKNAKWLAEQKAKQAAYEAEQKERMRGYQWRVIDKKDPMTDERTVVLYTAAVKYNGFLDNFPELKAKPESHPQLVVRCANNETDVYVLWDNNVADAGDYTQVQYRVGKMKANIQNWQRSTDYEALYARKPIELARLMEHEKQFLIKVTPEAGDIETATFNIDGLDKHLGKVKEACNWK